MRILLAVDGSPQSASAIQAVAARPWPAGSTVRVLAVVEYPPAPPVGELIVDDAYGPREQIAEMKKLTSDVAASLHAAGLGVEMAVREGNPRDGIIAEAKEWPADLIVLGSHGYTGLKRLVLGSVAQSVVSHAPCSVEVVRDRSILPEEKVLAA